MIVGALSNYGLMVGGVIFLIASVIALYVSGTEQLMVFVDAMIPGYLIPGYMLRTIKNGENV